MAAPACSPTCLGGPCRACSMKKQRDVPPQWGEPASGVLDLGFSVSGSYLTTSWARAQLPVLGG